MSAIVCGSKRSVFEDLSSSPPLSKKLRRFSSSSSSLLLLPHLAALFPDMDTHILERAIEECGDDIDSAIRSLNQLRLDKSSESSLIQEEAKVEGGGSSGKEEVLNMDGNEWVELFVREMMNASDMKDAKDRASRALQALEKSINTRAGSDAAMQISLQQENLMLRQQFKLVEMVRFGTEVVLVEQDGRKWKIRSRNSDGVSRNEIFDSVVVCNGHYTEPRVAQIPGIDLWPGKQLHSHNYRVPDPFKDQVVVVIGNFASGSDISRDLTGVAKEVHIAARSKPSETYEKLTGADNLWLHPMIETARKDGSIVFKNGKVVQADTIVHCTGYIYHFPFLNTNGYITVEDNCVGPLYKHVFPPALAPGLSFIGLPWMTLLFTLFELQSKWVAAVLSGRVTLPSEDKMMEDTNALYAKRDANGFPKRYTHRLGVVGQAEYLNWIADQIGEPPVEQWRNKELEDGYVRLATQSDTFRDKWDDDHLIVEAYEDFLRQKLISAIPSQIFG